MNFPFAFSGIWPSEISSAMMRTELRCAPFLSSISSTFTLPVTELAVPFREVFIKTLCHLAETKRLKTECRHFYDRNCKSKLAFSDVPFLVTLASPSLVKRPSPNSIHTLQAPMLNFSTYFRSFMTLG